MLVQYRRCLSRLVIIIGFGMSGILLAQEGYPLDGAWRGYRIDADDQQSLVVMVMKWDGETVNGTINPGRDSIRFRAASLQPETWTVRIAAMDRDGQPIEIVGELTDIGSYRRRIAGTWTEGGSDYPFELTRE